jgi:hypothetical protein
MIAQMFYFVLVKFRKNANGHYTPSVNDLVKAADDAADTTI